MRGNRKINSDRKTNKNFGDSLSNNNDSSPTLQTNRFPGYNVLEQIPSWDEETKSVILARSLPSKSLRFFTIEEEPICRSLLNRLLALDEGPSIEVIEGIDSRLAEEQTDGWYYEEMGPDSKVWKDSIRALDEHSKEQYHSPFHLLSPQDQDELLEAIRLSKTWRGFPAGWLWSLWMRYACTELYSNPQIWNEIGFGGPAYPRGYKALGADRLEPWEVREIMPTDPSPWADRIESVRAKHLSNRKKI